MIIFILAILLILLITFIIWTNQYYNPYKLYLFMGKKGIGKSTVLQMVAYEHYKKKWNVYCNIGDSKFIGAEQIDCSRLWEQDIKPHSIILIDEVNLLWDNRQFKSFPQELNQWFRMQRHKKVKVYMFSQTADVDKKIRDLTDRIYLVRKYFNVWIWCFPYEKDIDPPDPKRMQNPHEFVDTFHKKNVGPIGCVICWLPKWVKTHDSFSANMTAEEKERFLEDMHKQKVLATRKKKMQRTGSGKKQAPRNTQPATKNRQNNQTHTRSVSSRFGAGKPHY